MANLKREVPLHLEQSSFSPLGSAQNLAWRVSSGNHGGSETGNVLDRKFSTCCCGREAENLRQSSLSLSLPHPFATASELTRDARVPRENGLPHRPDGSSFRRQNVILKFVIRSMTAPCPVSFATRRANVRTKTKEKLRAVSPLCRQQGI